MKLLQFLPAFCFFFFLLFGISLAEPRFPTPYLPSPLPTPRHTPNPIPRRKGRKQTGPSPHPLDISRICNSRAFENKIVNWHASAANQFLRDFTIYYAELVRVHGLLHAISMAFQLPTMPACSLDAPYQCYLSCEQIIGQLHSDIYTAQAIYFVFLQASNIASAFKTIHDGLVTAQISTSQMIPNMVAAFVDSQQRPGVEMEMIKDIANFLVGRLAGWLMSELPVAMNAEQILGMVETEIRDQERLVAQLRQDRRDREEGSLEAAEERAGQLWAAARGMKPAIEGAVAGQIDGMIQGWAGEALGNVQTWGLPKGGGKTGEMMLQDFVRIGTTSARVALKTMSREMFQGPAQVKENGSTLLSEMMADGSFILPVGDGGDMDIFQGNDIELKISRTVLLKTLNALWSTHPIFISCTRDFRLSPSPDHTDSKSPSTFSLAPSCRRDTSGPPDSKACVAINQSVCYLYSHDTSGPSFTHHVTPLLGRFTFEEPPYSLGIPQIIVSSVLTANLTTKPGFLTTTIHSSSIAAKSLASTFEPDSPGMFSIPVCQSRYNWNTPTAGHFGVQALLNHVSPYNIIKTLPCNCGPWGRDTSAILTAMNLDPASVAGRCGRQVSTHIPDPLERWIGLCRVGVKRILTGGFTIKGRHEMCDEVVKVIEATGMEYADALKRGLPELYRALSCYVGVGDEKSKVKGEKRCKEIVGDGKKNGKKKALEVVVDEAMARGNYGTDEGRKKWGWWEAGKGGKRVVKGDFSFQLEIPEGEMPVKASFRAPIVLEKGDGVE